MMGPIRATSRPKDERGVVLQAFMFLVVSVLAGVLVSGLLIPVAGMMGMATRSATESFESMDSELQPPPLPERSRMFDASGDLLATFYDQNRVEVTLDQVAPVMKDAVLAIEDARFYEHGPLDVQGTMRAFLRNTGGDGGSSQGGSTITQQYVKLVLVQLAQDDEKAREQALEDSYGRKLQELRYAVEMEKTTHKDEILANYLNIAYFGNGAYGVQAAAKRFFSVSADELKLHQAAMLAGLIKDPVRLDVDKNKDAVVTRRNLVLSRMVATGAITAEQGEKASEKGLGLKPQETRQGCYSAKYAHFCDYAMEWLLEDKALGKDRTERMRTILEGGLSIKTTIDPRIQDGTQQAVSSQVYPRDTAVGAMTMVEPGTGAIKAMAQSRPYGKGKGKTFINYNVGQSDNGGIGVQPGSTFKPLVLAAAIQQRISIARSFPTPERMYYPAMTTCEGGYPENRTASVANSTSPGGSSLNAIQATARSVNTYYVNLLAETGICAPFKLATDLGIKRGDGKPLEQVQSFVLGTNNVTPLSMSEAYATFAARGKHCDATPVTEVLDRHGSQVKIRDANCEQAIPKDVADTVNYVLTQVVDGSDDGRTGRNMSMADQGIQVAGKTGTNDSRIYVSFMGYTTSLAAYAVIGDDHPKQQSLMNQTIGGRYVTGDMVWGGTLAGPMWLAAMRAAHQGLDTPGFNEPDSRKVAGIMIDVPNVVGQAQADAERILTDAGFRPQVTQWINSELPRGAVARQTPGGGTQAGSGGPVQLYISDGTPPPPPEPPEGPERPCKPWPECVFVPEPPGGGEDPPGGGEEDPGGGEDPGTGEEDPGTGETGGDGSGDTGSTDGTTGDRASG